MHQCLTWWTKEFLLVLLIGIWVMGYLQGPGMTQKHPPPSPPQQEQRLWKLLHELPAHLVGSSILHRPKISPLWSPTGQSPPQKLFTLFFFFYWGGAWESGTFSLFLGAPESEGDVSIRRKQCDVCGDEVNMLLCPAYQENFTVTLMDNRKLNQQFVPK